MNTVEQLERAGEQLSPTVHRVIAMLEEETRKATRAERTQYAEGEP